jgi:hypothetical protein
VGRCSGGVIESVTTEHACFDTKEVDRVETYMTKHFGPTAKWVKFNKAIWTVIGSAQDHGFNLSDVATVILAAICISRDA